MSTTLPKSVAMMTGIPVTRVAQSESSRLVKMGEELRGKVIGQDEAIGKVVRQFSVTVPV
jgi:ATP-dependent Clp protease ATP-binding subunit ClpC